MDLGDQLRELFPDHKPEEPASEQESGPDLWVQEAPILCKFEKRKGKPVTVLQGYTGATEDFKKLTKLLQSELQVGGSYKNDQIILQGNNRGRIMDILEGLGFRTKRVGG